ncbi:hypothetical protein [Rhizobium rhizophilum]|uniref:DUF2188 domain-containing protein n=1 Tax=Rhizobium rhizophilum TaxID=1850373 RepID=A0ABY2QTP4_9HYPH|nr:hypothetical protein [Rhizobium rhizophilum]THV13733.1 hypothetical protein E9677_12545 [Rhizobium rhizophilum]
MARVLFTYDFDYKPTPQVTIGYRAGMKKTVKRDCAERAIAAGKAVSLDRASPNEVSDGDQG